MSAAPLDDAESAALLERAFGEQDRVLLAVSGGADSVALLAFAAQWVHADDIRTVLVATVDHGLRAQAKAEIAAVAGLSASFGLPHATLPAPLARSDARIEQAARDLRYAALVAHARAVGAQAIATAHTLDDQAETVLMRLAAGSGPAGLAAMRPGTLKDGVLHVRPFLGVPKARLVATLRARALPWSEDAMNADLRFARARLRGSRPALEREGLTAERLGVLAARMARVERALGAALDAAYAAHVSRTGNRVTIAPGWRAEPDEIMLRLLGRVIAETAGRDVRLDGLERLAARTFQERSGAATLAGAKIVWRKDGAMIVTAAPARRSYGASPGSPLKCRP